MEGRNPYTASGTVQLFPDYVSNTNAPPEVDLTGWELRQAAILQGRNPYLHPGNLLLRPQDPLNAKVPEAERGTEVLATIREFPVDRRKTNNGPKKAGAKIIVAVAAAVAVWFIWR